MGHVHDFGADHGETPPPDWATEAAAATLAWVREFVVGLDLCPFAARPLERGRVSLRVSDAEHPFDLAEDLEAELQRLAEAEPERIETTLLVHPRCLEDFADANDFLDVAELLLDRLELTGVLQVVGFHPGYQFADAEPDAPENATNRSPWPMLHLLRSESVARAVEGLDDPDAIWQRNVALLRARAADDDATGA